MNIEFCIRLVQLQIRLLPKSRRDPLKISNRIADWRPLSPWLQCTWPQGRKELSMSTNILNIWLIDCLQSVLNVQGCCAIRESTPFLCNVLHWLIFPFLLSLKSACWSKVTSWDSVWVPARVLYGGSFICFGVATSING